MSSTASIVIRQAQTADLGLIRGLLCERDNKAWCDEDMHWLFFSLQPDRCIAWLAIDGDRPVGFTSMFLRTLCLEDETIQAGYWTNLYIAPGYSQMMLYPRLPMTMFEWIRQQKYAFLYAAVRRQKVAQAHQAIGFAKCGELRHTNQAAATGGAAGEAQAVGEVGSWAGRPH